MNQYSDDDDDDYGTEILDTKIKNQIIVTSMKKNDSEEMVMPR